ncbi:hypothetical protein Tco_0204996 [Tanacetum coccineum]
MTTLQFADTNNLVAFLTKSAESEGFEQIVDFLNASYIKYALTVNPTIYTSCIKQFWSTVKAKTVNGEVQLQAFVDGKKIIVTEASVRRDIQLEDADGIDCLPNAIIFEQLTLIGAKTTVWNEFSSTIASAIICLATNQKFNFSKYIFESMVKNLDSAGKFLMYPRFVQVFLDNQLEGMINHNRIYIAPSHINKGFANMKRQGKDFSGRVTPLFSTMMVQAQQEQCKGSDMPTNPHHIPTILPPSTSQPLRKQRPRKPKRKDIKIPQSSVPMENVANEAVYEERDDSLERATTIATGLDAEQDRGNIFNTQSKATPNEPSSIGTSSSVGPRRQDTIGDTIAHTRSENVSKFSNDPLIAGVNTPRSDDEASLGDQEDASKQGRKIHDIDADEDITLENVHDADMFGVHDLDGDEVFIETEEPVVNAATTTSIIPVSAAKDLSDVDMTLAQALAELKSTKPKAVTIAATTTTTAVTRPKTKGLIIQDQEQASTPITSSKDKGNEIMDKVKTDYELAQRLQAEEQEELTIKEKSKLFQQLLEKRRKFFAAKRAKEKRNKPPTKAQQRSIMTTYLKNIAGWKPKDLKTKFFANVQELFDKAMKKVNTFVDMDTELMEGSETREESSSKRAGDELEQEPSKKQKVDDDKETEELKQCMEIISDDGDDVTIKATPLSTKSPTIMLKNFDREDLEVLWSIVKAIFKKTEPMNYMDIFLHLNLKTMFEHHLEDSVWKNQQGLVKVLN